MALQDIRAEIFDCVLDFSFILRMAVENEQVLRELPHVRWVSINRPFGSASPS